jgi:subtilisin family serine protease
MKRLNRSGWAAMASAVAIIAATIGSTVAASASAATVRGPEQRFLVTAATQSAYDAALKQANRDGLRISLRMPEIKTFVVTGRSERTAALAKMNNVRMGRDHIEQVALADRPSGNVGGFHRQVIDLSGGIDGGQFGIHPDPAFRYKGLLWDYKRVNVQDEWPNSAGDPAVLVGVSDTGLDFTHVDLRRNIVKVVDFTQSEDPPICDPTDKELADEFHGPAKTDWYGHGSWIGGNIAGTLNHKGINGIAPKVGLVSLKISGNCGSAYDSTILDSYLYAANHGIDIVSNSFGGYLDLSDPSQELIYQNYIAAVKYAHDNGTVVVAAAGNEHLRIGTGGEVLSHGPLSAPGAPFQDYFGFYEVPGGVPGVVDVAATGNLVNEAQAKCPRGTKGKPTKTAATCKPLSDPHQAAGQGLKDQLAYYSNYGPRIDVAGPGGARKFNLPVWDRGGTPGFPYTNDDLTNVWEAFSVTSNWALNIPCFTFTDGSGFPPFQCYSSIQGTSMATPHASVVLALIASANPGLRHNVDALIAALKAGTISAHNETEPIDAGDTSNGDLTGIPCDSGYCHLGGSAIPDAEAYGAGIVQATAAG